MAMGIVNDDDFAKELSKTTPQSDLPKSENGKIVDIKRGRGPGDVETPDSIRKLIGESAFTDGREEALKLASALGISPSSVSAYTKGATSTSTYNDRPNESHITDVKERISKRARGKLMSALKHITEDKLVDTKARELAGIAKDMSAVIKNMEPPNPNQSNVNNGPTFVFYSPKMRDEKEFTVIDASE